MTTLKVAGMNWEHQLRALKEVPTGVDGVTKAALTVLESGRVWPTGGVDSQAPVVVKAPGCGTELVAG